MIATMSDILTRQRREGMAHTLAVRHETPSLVITDGDVLQDEDGYWVPALVLVTLEEVDERLGITEDEDA